MEQTGLERVDAMREYLQEAPEDVRLDVIVERRLGTIRTEFAKAVETPVRKLVGGKTGGMVVIAYLRSSIVTGSHVFCIAYYKGEPFVEEEPERVYLDLRGVFKDAEADCMEMNRILGKNLCGFWMRRRRRYADGICICFMNGWVLLQNRRKKNAVQRAEFRFCMADIWKRCIGQGGQEA